VFDVEVRRGKTERVSVEEGVVQVMLEGGVDVILHAGEAWRRPVAPVASAVASREPAAPAASKTTSSRAVQPPVKSADSWPSGVSDAAAEDAAYLHVIQLLRGGKRDDARAAAREYLAAYPNGFRREEMLRVASSSAP
jgi:TolA-binding protein